MGPYFNKLGSKRRYLSPEYLKKNMVPFPELQCHPCAGAMLIFSVSFQF